MRKRTIEDVDLSGQTVLLRADFNVPLEDGRITDDSRIQATLPTILYLLTQNARVVCMSHLGRPKGRRTDEFSLAPVAVRLAELLQRPVVFAPDCVGAETKAIVDKLPEGGVALLENLRFHPEEEAGDAGFAKRIAELGTYFVNDAFGAAHRAHASVSGLPACLPSAAGLLMAKEIEYFSMLSEKPERPYVAIIGGAKVKDKIAVLKRLVERVDAVLIGGAMAYTFLKAQGKAIGASRLEEESLGVAKEILDLAAGRGVAIELPFDHIIGDRFAPDAQHRAADDIEDGWMGLDIGPKTAAKYSKIILNAKTAVWNGPMGVFEWDLFSKGTLAVATALSEMNGVSVVGGGDSLAAAVKFGVDDDVTHASTGGGASLEFLEGKVLPGVAALPDA